jgi:hypothetical protein
MDTRTDDHAAEPRTVGEARDAVERSRERISSTLDRLEDRIVEKKHELQERVDVLRPVRERVVQRPLTAVMVGLGVGAFLGSLGGGDDEEHEHRHARSGRLRGSALSDDERHELREWRKARRERLRSSARRQRDDAEHEDGGARFDGLKHQLMGAVTSAITTAVTRRVRRMAMDNISGMMGGGQTEDGRPSRERSGTRGEWSGAQERSEARY